MIDGRRGARDLLDGGGEAAGELMDVVRVEQIVLASVLGLDHSVDRRRHSLERRARGRAFHALSVSEAARRQIGVRQIGPAFPRALVQQRREPRSIRTRPRPEDRVPDAASGALRTQPGRDRVVFVGLPQGPDEADSVIDHVDLERESVAEEARDSEEHVHARAPEIGEGQDLEAYDAAGSGLPLRRDPDQRQRLRDVVAAGSHVRRAPGRDGEPPRPLAIVLEMPTAEQVGGSAPKSPGGFGRSRARVEGEEVAARRQRVEAGAGRRAGGSGRHEAAVEGAQQAFDLRRATGVHARRDHRRDLVQHRRGSRQ